MEYFYRIADIRIRAESPFPILENNFTKEFFSDAAADAEADLVIEYRPVDALPEAEDIRYEETRRVYTGQGVGSATFFSATPLAPPYAWVPRDTIRQGKLVCHYLPDNERRMKHANNVITLMDLEATLLHFNALILHASLIRWNGMGVVFSAPSGTGKSTQAELWAQHAGAEILNGDRAALRQRDGVWHAYGLPYSGTSGIYRNERVPLGAVVALRQSSENSIRRIHGAEAFRYLYPETMIHRWDPEYEAQATKLLLDVIQEIPVYLLSCRPDREAVELLKSKLEAKEQQL